MYKLIKILFSVALIKVGKVITNRNEYIEEYKTQLSASTFYEETEESNLQKQNTKLRKEIMNLKAYNYISEKEYKFLSKHLHSFGTPIFYGLPKIHKLFVRLSPLRPIAPGFNCISTSLPEYVDSLQYQAKTWKSYIRDTADFLLKFKSLHTINFHLSHYGGQ